MDDNTEDEGTLQIADSTPADHIDHSNNLKSTLAQCLATYINSLSYMSLGLMYVISTVVLPDLKEVEAAFLLNDSEISWYVSLLPAFQPLGCVIGGFLQNYIGRKHGLMLMNASTVTAWLLLYYAKGIGLLYTSTILMGISVGFAEAPSVTYICEITTPRLRGTLVTYNNSNVYFGIMLTFLLATFMGWRSICLVCTVFSIVTAALLLFIPDSPVWLINKGRKAEAVRALQWLRGWVPETYVMPEYEKLSQSMKRSGSFSDEEDVTVNNRRRGTARSKLDELLKPPTLRPFVFLCLYMCFTYMASIQPAKNYYIAIFDELHLNMDSKKLNFLNCVASLFGSLACAATVKFAGKRYISLTSMLSSSLISVALGLYIAVEGRFQAPSIFVGLFILLGFAMGYGIATIPWVILGEIFPVRTRSAATGITGAAYYISLAVLVKSYYYLELLLTRAGVFIFYGSLGIVGFFFLWVYMPETEGKTMADIEELFKDDARRTCVHFRRKK